MSPVDKEIELEPGREEPWDHHPIWHSLQRARPDQTRPDAVPYGRFKLLLTHVNKHATIGKTEQGRG